MVGVSAPVGKLKPEACTTSICQNREYKDENM